MAGIHLCAGILGALVQRERTGQGQRVEVAMHEAAVIRLASALGAMMDGVPTCPSAPAAAIPALAMAPYNTYPCADGHVAIFTSAERHWHAMCRLLGRAELIGRPGFASMIGRAQRMAEVDDMISAWTIGRTKEEVMRLLNEAHVPGSPVKTVREVARDPHLGRAASGSMSTIPRRGPARVPISPIRLHTGGRAEVARRRRPWVSTPTPCWANCSASVGRSAPS